MKGTLLPKGNGGMMEKWGYRKKTNYIAVSFY
jgi:hypothetical protein